MILMNNGGSSSKTYIDDLFVSYLRTGNGSTQNITTGFQPDLVWTKSRSASTGHRLVDSIRGVGNSLETSSTLAQQSEATGITALNANGYSIGADSDYNTNTATYVDFVFRKAQKFFDVVTYTGNGLSSQTVAHSLGIEPGMIIIKRTDSTSNWFVWHRKDGVVNQAVSGLSLNLTNAAVENGSIQQQSTSFNTSLILDTSFASPNVNGASYVAYLFAHDPSADGIIQCGSFTTDASGNATVDLGWEPQFVLTKNSVAVADWEIVDTMRGAIATQSTTSNPVLAPNNTSVEFAMGSQGRHIAPTATGFTAKQTSSQTYIYLAIRRPNKPPTSGTEVYNAITRNGTGDTIPISGVGFSPDFIMSANRPHSANFNTPVTDRLRGIAAGYLNTNTMAADGTSTGFNSFDMDGFTLNANVTTNSSGGTSYVFWNFRRAPGFFDVVCYTGTGVARTVNHGLGVAPELMIVKTRSGSSSNWAVYHSAISATQYIPLNTTGTPITTTTIWNDTAPTPTVFSVGTSAAVNGTSATYVAYLFATLPGISKVDSYTGNGTSQTINCGFSAGARFVLIRRTDSTGDWFVWDTARGILSANDPHLSLNTTTAEVTTDDSVDPNNIGFDVLQNTATNINVSSATYIFLAIA